MQITIYLDGPSFQLLVFGVTVLLIGQYIIMLVRDGQLDQVRIRLDLLKMRLTWFVKSKKRRNQQRQKK